jgi:hypothetical protein
MSITAYGQTISDVFKTMPTELLPGVSEANKTMLLADTAKTPVSFILGEITKLHHTDDYLKIRTSAVGTTQLKLLPITNDSVIICVVKTVCGRACDSHISFYTTKWEKLETSTFLPEISAKDFFDSSQKDSENYKYAVSLSDILPISAQFNESNTNIELTFNYKQHLSANVIAEMAPFLKTDTIVLQWRNGKFQTNDK